MKTLYVKRLMLVLFVLLVGLIGSWELGLIGKKDAPDTLHVRSIGSVSVDISIHDVSSVQYLYDAVYSLPVVPPFKSFHCPLDIGPVYHLSFLHNTTLIQTMDLSATGCQLLHIVPFNTRITNASFNELLAKMLNRTSLQPDH